jgi:hypothetical protein
MKMSAANVERTLQQFQAQAIPDNHPVCSQLRSMFGDHTYFLDGKGLNIVEPTDDHEAGDTVCAIISLADWGDNSQRTLVPHEPEATTAVVILADTDTTH